MERPRKNGRTNFTVRVKEQVLRLTLKSHRDDDDDDANADRRNIFSSKSTC
jgi:hypothetical protein